MSKVSIDCYLHKIAFFNMDKQLIKNKVFVLLADGS